MSYGGPYAGPMQSPFNGMGFYTNGDYTRLLQLFQAYDARADYNLDGRINALDVRLFLPHQFVL